MVSSSNNEGSTIYTQTCYKIEVYDEIKCLVLTLKIINIK